MRKIRHAMNKLKAFIKKNFALKKIFKRRLLKSIFLSWLIVIFLFGGFAIWKAATTPATKTYPQISLPEISQFVKREGVEHFHLKYITENKEVPGSETNNKLVIFVKLKTGEILSSPTLDFNRLNYTEIINQIKDGGVESIIVLDASYTEMGDIIVLKMVLGWSKEKTVFIGNFPPLLANLDNLSALLTEHGIQCWELKTKTIGESNFWAKWGPMILLFSNILGFLLFVMSSNNFFGKQKEPKEKITFADVAGIDEAKSEITEILDFIKFPERYIEHGAKMPRGALLVGPPGCGKTLLAKALASEAGVPFKSVAGSEFVEKYVGVGASRVRSLFHDTKRTAQLFNTTAILFIDEIDALGTRKFDSQGDAEYNQTITQVLHEMDGFKPNEKIFVIGATNCPEILDPAIRRPGRFDRQVIVQIPDLKGRKAILEVHCKNKKLHSSVDLQKIAEMTPLGFSGADLANVANEAAIRAAKFNKDVVEMEDLEKSIEKVLVGSERKSAVMSDEDKWRTAWHEAGHAIAAKFTPSAAPPQKISIVPTTKGVGGYTATLQTEERYYWTKQELLGRIKTLFGGRIAEELIFGEGNISTGAREDFRQATQIAEEMVCDLGMMTAILGPRTFGATEGNPHLGRTFRRQDYSEETAKAVDRAQKALLTQCYQEAKKTLEHHLSKIRLLAEALKTKETLNIQEINQLLD